MFFSNIKVFFVFSFLMLFFNGYSQISPPTIVRGLITDATTHEPIPFAYVTFLNSEKAMLADSSGVFAIETTDTTSFLKVGYMGYQTIVLLIETSKNQFVDIQLKPESKILKEVVVKGRRTRYKNRGNPAVKIIEEVIDHKSLNRVENIDNLQYEQYQKLLLSFENVSDKLAEFGLLKPFRFILENTDTTIISGKKLLPVYLKENISDYYYQKDPPASREIIKAEKLVSFDEYIDRKTLTTSINYLYQNINIYDNNILLFSNRFLSPIASMSPAFYKFFISDTVILDSIKCVRIAFSPRNKRDFLFQGYLFVSLDSAYAVKKIKMRVNEEINLNWVKSVSIDQEFQKREGGWLLSRSEMSADFGITKNTFGLCGQKINLYTDYKLNKGQNDSIFKDVMPESSKETLAKDEKYWHANRPIQLRNSEHNIYIFMDSLRNIPEFHRDMTILSLLTLGYLKLGPIEIGPTTTIYSQNPIEGSRIRLGLRTTRKFNNKIYFETYGAYGAKDKQFKYNLSAVYSLNDKSVREFPLKSVGISFQNDLKIPGQDLLNAQSDNTLLSFKRGLNDKMYFNKYYRIEHLNEFASHFSYSLAYEYSQNKPVGNLYFNTNSYADYTNNIGQINVAQLSIDLRYAPHERFVQGNRYRSFFPNKYPVMELKYMNGFKFLGSDYEFQKIQANISKRFNLSILGYSDFEIEAGKIYGHLPYLLLEIHRANQTYAYQPLSYNLMNFLEFISDQYAAVYLDHNFNGFFFNKVPLIKKLKFREAFTFKMLYGSLSNTNNPLTHMDIPQFPTDHFGNPLSYTLEKRPYIEAGFGITNPASI
jgi:hypothetical protein